MYRLQGRILKFQRVIHSDGNRVPPFGLRSASKTSSVPGHRRRFCRLWRSTAEIVGSEVLGADFDGAVIPGRTASSLGTAMEVECLARTHPACRFSRLVPR